MTIDLSRLALVYVAFLIKHCVADYALQVGWMARGKAQTTGWLWPLTAHAGVHGALTLVLCLVFAPSLWWLGVVDVVVHGTIDRTKGRVTAGWTPGEHRFWTAFGIDQMAHELTHFVYVLAILSRMPTG